jgi:hypothetical protein
MYKLAAIVAGVLLMAGVALAGTVSSLGSTGSPTIGQTIPTAGITAQQGPRGHEGRHEPRGGHRGSDDHDRFGHDGDGDDD